MVGHPHSTNINIILQKEPSNIVNYKVSNYGTFHSMAKHPVLGKTKLKSTQEMKV